MQSAAAELGDVMSPRPAVVLACSLAAASPREDCVNYAAALLNDCEARMRKEEARQRDKRGCLTPLPPLVFVVATMTKWCKGRLM